MGNTALQEFLGITISRDIVEYEILDKVEKDQYVRQLIRYEGSESDEIRAYLFLPKKSKILGSVLVHHQHNGERHFGKSEVAGIVGDPYQSFCPALASKGIIALAPDSICFEDRRKNQIGIQAALDKDDEWLKHYNEMSYRILRGDSLMKKVVEDSSIGISLLANTAGPTQNKIGILGHSYGGNTVIFHSPFDDRINYSCTSGAVCSYKTKMINGIGIEMAEVIPGFLERFDIEDLLREIAPRKLLILSADEDKYSKDAEAIYKEIQKRYKVFGAEFNVELKRNKGKHGLNNERFQFIISWFENEFNK